MSTDNLWGELGTEKITLPLTILKAQAAKLGELTDNVLQGNIDQVPPGDDWEFAYVLDIIAPALNNYTYTVLRIMHDVAGYPATVFDCVDGFESAVAIETEDEFVRHLASILSSRHVRGVVNALLTQSADVSK